MFQCATPEQVPWLVGVRTHTLMWLSMSPVFKKTDLRPGYTVGGSLCNQKASLISGERAVCLEVLICEWEGRRKLGNPGLCLYPRFHICIYKNTYTHTEGKQNKAEQSIAHGPPLGSGRENKQAADVNRVTAPGTAGRSVLWCQGGVRNHQNRRQQETPEAGEDLKAERSWKCRHTGRSPPLAPPQGEEVPGAKVDSERWP